MKSKNSMKKMGVSALAVGMLIVIMLSSNSPMIFAVLPEGGGGGGGSYKSYAILGYVKDNLGNVIVGASISITGTASGTTTTGSTGFYYRTLTKYNGPSTGSFTVTASKSGHVTSTKSVSVPAGSSRRVDFNLQIIYIVTITADQLYVYNDDEPEWFFATNPAEAYMKTPSGNEVRLGDYNSCASSSCWPLHDISSYGVSYTTTVTSLSGSFNFELRDKVVNGEIDLNGDTPLWQGYVSIESEGTSTGWSYNGVGNNDIGVATIVTTYTLYTNFDPCSPTSCGASNFYNSVQFTVQITAS